MIYNMLERLLRSKAEVAVLGIALFSDGLHLREIARRADVSSYEAKRELDNLVKIGVLNRAVKGNLSIYSLNHLCPFVNELRNLYLRTEGIIPLLKSELNKLTGIKHAFVYGSFATGDFVEKSDVDLFIVGNAEAEEIDSVCLDVQKKTLREVNYILWSMADFRKKLKEGGVFISSLISKKKIWLVGEENEFERDAEKA